MGPNKNLPKGKKRKSIISDEPPTKLRSKVKDASRNCTNENAVQIGTKQKRKRQVYLLGSDDNDDDNYDGQSSLSSQNSSNSLSTAPKSNAETSNPRAEKAGTSAVNEKNIKRNNRVEAPSENLANFQASNSSVTENATAIPEWLALQFDQVREQIQLKQSRVEGVMAAGIISFSEIADQDQLIQRNEKALKISEKGVVNQVERFMAKVSKELGFESSSEEESDSSDDEEEETEGEGSSKKLRRRSKKPSSSTAAPSTSSISDQPVSPEEEPYEEACRALPTVKNSDSFVLFGGRKFKLARTKDEFAKFSEEIKERIASFANDPNRRRLMESRNEISITKAIAALHRWLVFCCVSSVNPEDQLTSDGLGKFRDWMLKLTPNSKSHYPDPSRFGSTYQLEFVGGQMARIFFMYKIMDLAPIDKGLRLFMGGRKDYEMFGQWAKMQLGCKTPFDRLVIYPDDVDLFIETLEIQTDAEFQAALYLLVMVETGARSSSLIETSHSLHPPLLVEDCEFELMSNGRVSVKVTLRHEKQARTIDHGRVVTIEDRIIGNSCSMMLFAWFVRLSVFKNSAAIILDPNHQFGPGGGRFELKEDFKKSPVFRRPMDATKHADIGRVSANALTTDGYIFDLFSRTLRVSRRGFSSRSVRQGVAHKIIMDHVIKAGKFDQADAINQLKGTRIWESKRCLRYVKSWIDQAYNPTAVMYDSSVVNPDGQTSKIRLPRQAVKYRLPAEEYLEREDARVLEFVETLDDVKAARSELKVAEADLKELLAGTGMEPRRFRFTEKQLTIAGVDVQSYNVCNKRLLDARSSLKELIRDRLPQYTDHFNYQNLKRRLENKSNEVPTEVSGKTFDFRALCNAMEQFDAKDGLWSYSWAKKPTLVPDDGVLCVAQDCDFVAKNASVMTLHLARVHGVQEVSAKRTKLVQLIGSRGGKTVGANPNATTVHLIETADQNSVSQNDEEETTEITTSEKKKNPVRLVCKDEKCSKNLDGRERKRKGYINISDLRRHFRMKHWSAYKCQSCEEEHTQSSFVEAEHEDHDVTRITNNFPFSRYMETKCVKCEAYAVEQKLSNVLCICRLQKVRSALETEYVRSLFRAYCLGIDCSGLDALQVLEIKRKLIFNELKHRLYDRTDVLLPTCVVKEVKRKFWHRSLTLDDIVSSQEM